MKSVPRIPLRPKQAPSYQELQNENERLKAQLREAKDTTSGVKLCTQEKRLEINNLQTPDISVDRLSVESPAVDEVGQLLSSASLLQSKGKLPVDRLKKVTQEPVRVESMRVRVPSSTINRIAQSSPNKNLKGVEVEFGEEGAFRVKGTVDKMIDIPFELNGFVDSTEEGQVRMRIGKSKLFGIISVPKLIQDMAGAMAGKKLDKLGVSHTDEGLLLDTQSLLPKNLDFKVGQVTTKKGELIVEGGPRNPEVLTMGPWGPIPQTEP